MGHCIEFMVSMTTNSSIIHYSQFTPKHPLPNPFIYDMFLYGIPISILLHVSNFWRILLRNELTGGAICQHIVDWERHGRTLLSRCWGDSGSENMQDDQWYRTLGDLPGIGE